MNKSQVALLIDFTDGTERILHPNQYVLYNGPAEITEVAKRELVDIGLVSVWEVNSTEITTNMSKAVDKERGRVPWMAEGF